MDGTAAETLRKRGVASGCPSPTARGPYRRLLTQLISTRVMRTSIFLPCDSGQGEGHQSSSKDAQRQRFRRRMYAERSKMGSPKVAVAGAILSSCWKYAQWTKEMSRFLWLIFTSVRKPSSSSESLMCVWNAPVTLSIFHAGLNVSTQALTLASSRFLAGELPEDKGEDERTRSSPSSQGRPFVKSGPALPSYLRSSAARSPACCSRMPTRWNCWLSWRKPHHEHLNLQSDSSATCRSEVKT
ncbi:unnamed protein product [Prorocentrum cordatum]|uniref:Uncharacterized protein n=1 Tax=Prorocentrum cordatum TaxID=2364126 RepID=A0ABN9S5E0_9DINO|nr:unnamed protein product [Polarella glacialis]